MKGDDSCELSCSLKHSLDTEKEFQGGPAETGKAQGNDFLKRREQFQMFVLESVKWFTGSLLSLAGPSGSRPLENADPAIQIRQLQITPAGEQLCIHHYSAGRAVCHQNPVSSQQWAWLQPTHHVFLIASRVTVNTFLVYSWVQMFAYPWNKCNL